jgi:hypothetical protein
MVSFLYVTGYGPAGAAVIDPHSTAQLHEQHPIGPEQHSVADDASFEVVHEEIQPSQMATSSSAAIKSESVKVETAGENEDDDDESTVVADLDWDPTNNQLTAHQRCQGLISSFTTDACRSEVTVLMDHLFGEYMFI